MCETKFKTWIDSIEFELDSEKCFLIFLLHFQFIFQVKANVISACQGRQVSYPFFVAFINLLSNIELIKKVYLNATNGSRTFEVTKGKYIILHQVLA